VHTVRGGAHTISERAVIGMGKGLIAPLAMGLAAGAAAGFAAAGLMSGAERRRLQQQAGKRDFVIINNTNY